MFKIEKWNDFINKTIVVNINNKKFFGTFYSEGRELYIKVIMTNDVEEWRKSSIDFEFITGSFIEEDEKITLLNCAYVGYGASGVDPILYADLKFKIDRIILGYSLKNITDKFIKYFSISYKDITWFTNKRLYKYEVLKDSILINNARIEYKLKELNITFDVFPKIVEKNDSIEVVGDIMFTFAFKKDVDIYKSIRYAYILKNLLMLFFKNNIFIINQVIEEDLVNYQVIDCGDDFNFDFENKERIQRLKVRNGFKIEELSNFDSIMNRFVDLYERLMPILELYYIVLNNNVPYLTRFVSDLTMLESFSREFDNSNALKLTKSKKGKKQKNDADYIDRVISLINNINEVFNFTASEVEYIAKTIKDARTYYVHYEDKDNKIRKDTLFKYAYFVEDIVLINIYKLLGIDIKNIKNISFNDFYYDINEFLQVCYNSNR